MIERHAHWCAVCDAKIVDSAKPETGRWFAAAGHAWSSKGKYEGAYYSVLFAICPDCDPLEALHEITEGNDLPHTHDNKEKK